ncbi:hypothetical protein Rhopal_003323-T1 [Rhodotorula paludigena]|uniref:Uncharacterized protein n=1 Tax=Rhodotorula paludigena TaxID=86838 RepID=A0AAV5GK64_9BASI|nr:hypothetical protein Rhopal_003323-T1 [Rhodotorula paludigena]
MGVLNPPGPVVIDTPDGCDHLNTVDEVHDAVSRHGRFPRIACRCVDTDGCPVTAGLAASFSAQNPGELYIRCRARSTAIARLGADASAAEKAKVKDGCEVMWWMRDVDEVHGLVARKAIESGELTASLPSPIVRLLLDATLDENGRSYRLRLPTFTHDRQLLLDSYKAIVGSDWASPKQDMAQVHFAYDLVYALAMLLNNQITNYKDGVNQHKQAADLDQLFRPPPSISADRVRKFTDEINKRKHRKKPFRTPMPTYTSTSTSSMSPFFPGTGQVLGSTPSSDPKRNRTSTPTQLRTPLASPSHPLASPSPPLASLSPPLAPAIKRPGPSVAKLVVPRPPVPRKETQHKPEVSGKISVDKEDRMSLDEILTAFKPVPISPPLAADTIDDDTEPEPDTEYDESELEPEPDTEDDEPEQLPSPPISRYDKDGFNMPDEDKVGEASRRRSRPQHPPPSFSTRLAKRVKRL